MPPDDFKRDILFETGRLRKLAEAARSALERPGLRKDAWDAAAAGKLISDLIGGLESLLKRKARLEGIFLALHGRNPKRRYGCDTCVLGIDSSMGWPRVELGDRSRTA
jgi:hypothetical protein